jgi:hypothetical protein
VRKVFLFAAVLGLAGLWAGPVSAQTAVAGVSDLFIKYEKAVQDGDRITASGGVEIRYKNLILFCDTAELNQKTKDVVAEGHVTLHLPQETFSTERLVFNLDTGLGKGGKALGFLQPTIRYETSSIERKSDNLYAFEKSTITTCTQPDPRWKFTCARANFKKNDYIEMWNAVVSVKSVPVFYWPYLRYPLQSDRSTGFLVPQVGYSQIKGLVVSEDFFWAVARNMDATFSLDYYSAKGIGGGLQYRYITRDGTSGQADLYYFLFKKTSPLGGEPAPATPASYIVRLNHSQVLPLGFNLVAAVDYQNSFDFLREFDNNYQRALVFLRRSQVYISKAWSSYSFSIRASRMETHFPSFGAGGMSIINDYLPQVSFSTFKRRLFKPVYFSFGSGFNRWQYGTKAQFDAHRQLGSQNLYLTPTLSVPFNSIPWLTVNFDLEGVVNYYFKSYSFGTRDIINEPLLTGQYAAAFDLIGPVFFRVWEVKGGKLQHLVEPTFSYRYESPVSVARQIITPYGFFFRLHQFSYGVTNRVLLKKGNTPREIFTWGISQTYYLSPEDSPLAIYSGYLDGRLPRFGEIVSYLRFFPAAKMAFDFSAGYNTYQSTVSSLRLSASLGAPTDPLFLSLNWFKATNPWYQETWYNRHQIGIVTGLRIPRLNLEALGEVDWNIGERKLLYAGGSFVYHYQCLDFKGDIRVFNFRSKPEIQYRLTFGLGNIGKSTDFMGGLDLK